jgi:hypothetical protein
MRDRKRQVQYTFCLLGHVLDTGRDVAGTGTEYDRDGDASLVYLLRMPIPYRTRTRTRTIPYRRNCTKNRPVDLNKGYVALMKVYGTVFGAVSKVRVWVRLSCALYPYLVLWPYHVPVPRPLPPCYVPVPCPLHPPPLWSPISEHCFWILINNNREVAGNVAPSGKCRI